MDIEVSGCHRAAAYEVGILGHACHGTPVVRFRYDTGRYFLGDEVEEIIEDDRDLLLPADRPLHEIRDNLRQDRHRIRRPSTLRRPRRREEGNEEGDT